MEDTHYSNGTVTQSQTKQRCQVTARIPPGLREDLRAAVQASGQRQGKIIEQALCLHLQRELEKQGQAMPQNLPDMEPATLRPQDCGVGNLQIFRDGIQKMIVHMHQQPGQHENPIPNVHFGEMD